MDSTDHCGPVTYLHGNEQIFPALEQAVDGLRGGRGTPPLAVADRELRRAPTGAGAAHAARPTAARARALRSASATPCDRRAGEPTIFRLVGVEGDEVLADFNNAAAGQGLEIWAKVVAVRAATAEEIRRGTLR